MLAGYIIGEGGEDSLPMEVILHLGPLGRSEVCSLIGKEDDGDMGGGGGERSEAMKDFLFRSGWNSPAV